MKRIPTWILVWIVTWKVLVVRHGVETVRYRNARFSSEAAARAFRDSQVNNAKKFDFTVTQK